MSAPASLQDPSSGFSSKRRIRTSVLLYVLVSFIWIFASDKLTANLAVDHESIALWSTIKGWLFVVATGFFWFGMMSRFARKGEEYWLQYKDLYENSPDMLFTVDYRSGTITECNETLAAVTGFSKADIVGRSVATLYTPECRESVMASYNEFHVAGAGSRSNRRILRKDGTAIDVNLKAGVEYDDQGQAVAIHSVLRDISELKKVEQELIESENRYRQLVQTSPMAILAHQDGRFVYANDSALRLFGARSVRELVGTPILDRVHPDSHALVLERVRQVVEEGRNLAAVEEKLLRVDGAVIDATVTSTTLTYDARPAAQMVINDITERKRAEEALRASERIFRLITEHIEEVFWMADAELSKVLYVSPQYEEIWGRTRKSLYDSPWSFIVGADSGDHALAENIRESRRKGEPFDLEYAIVRPDGSVRHIWDKGFPVRDESGTLMNYVGVAQDITRRKDAEKELEHEALRRRVLFDKSPDSVLIIDPESTGFLDFNTRAHTQLGYTREEFARLTIFDVEASESKAETRAHITEVFRTGRADFETLQRTKSGEVRNVFVTAQVVDFGGHHVYHCVWRDITERKRAELELQTSKARLDAALASMTDAVFISDTAGTFTHFNDAFATFHKFKNKEECAKVLTAYPAFLDVYADTGELAPLEQWAVPRALRGETGSNVEYKLHRKDTGETWVGSYSFSPIRNEHGAVVGSVVVGRDISEHKKAEEALRHSEEKFRTVADWTFDWEYWTDPQGQLLYVSPSCKRITGFDAEEFVADPGLLERIVHLDDRLPVGLHERKMFESDKVHEIAELEYRIVSRYGAERWIAHLCRPVFGVDGRYLGRRVSNRDITEGKRNQRKLEEQARLLDVSRDAILVRDMNDRILYMNRAAEQLYGWSLDEVDALNIRTFLVVEEMAMFEEYKAILIAKGEWEGEVHQRSRTGREVLVLARWTLVRDSHGNPSSWLTINTDITEKRNLETQLAQAQKLDAIGRLAGGIAHDFNNMIGVILGYAKLLELQLNPTDSLLKHVGAITTAAERSASLTRQLLGFARKQVVAPVPLNLNDSLAGMQKVLGRLVGEDIGIVFSPGNELWNVKIDPTQVDQILTNLASNARDAISNTGTITIATTNVTIDEGESGESAELAPGDYVRMSFTDTGAGMDRATQEQIFEPFFTTKQKGKGTGLGLATVFGIVKQNNGVIRVTSEVGGGTTFMIFLPRCKGEVERVAELEQEIQLHGSETILVVEDEKQLLDLVRTSLETYGYSVLSAGSPDEAILLFESRNEVIKLVISDVVMPAMNGKELSERIRTMRVDARFIFMSGYTADIVANRGVLHEGITFLPKPFTPVTLARKVREVLDRPIAPAEEG
jgi:PAS domain S-box-containing protein